MYTAHSDYSATGEGRTLMILYSNLPTENQVLDRFKSIFSDYMAIGATIVKGIDFDNRCAKFLLSDPIKRMLQDNVYMEYFASIHYNYS